jgi:hypothetical protein
MRQSEAIRPRCGYPWNRAAIKTDKPIDLYLNAGPEAFRVLTGGISLVGDYRFCSLTVKGLERRLDGICEPEGHDGPVYVLEFQGRRPTPRGITS